MAGEFLAYTFYVPKMSDKNAAFSTVVMISKGIDMLYTQVSPCGGTAGLEVDQGTGGCSGPWLTP
jgi:hypothetical protein